MPLPEVVFSDEIGVNVSKKVGEPKVVKVRAVASKEYPNSYWEPGKVDHTIHYKPK